MYIQVTFFNVSESIKDLIIAALQEQAEGFEEDATNLKVIFLSKNFKQETITAVSKAHQLEFELNEIGEQNWNEIWESNFEPVYVDNFAGIRAAFHQPLKNVLHEIIITPKMSFGTGHHATTYLMINQMRKTDFINKSVFDFGTGTGVLAILAKKLGADDVTASDIDDWSIINARENFSQNNTKEITLVHSDTLILNQTFDIILANINKNVLLENGGALSTHLNKRGTLILSGILKEDKNQVIETYMTQGLNFITLTQMNQWLCLVFNNI